MHGKEQHAQQPKETKKKTHGKNTRDSIGERRRTAGKIYKHIHIYIHI